MKRWLIIAGVLAALTLVLWLADWDVLAILEAFGLVTIAGILLLLCMLTIHTTEANKELEDHGDIF